jgi:hypothetical protein
MNNNTFLNDFFKTLNFLDSIRLKVINYILSPPFLHSSKCVFQILVIDTLKHKLIGIPEIITPSVMESLFE